MILMQIIAIKTNLIWSVEINSHVHDSILCRFWRLHLIFFKISSWSYQEFHLYIDKTIGYPVSIYESRLWNEVSTVIQLNSRITMIKDHVINVKFYISFTRKISSWFPGRTQMPRLHEMSGRGLRQFVSWYVSRFEKMWSLSAVTPGKDVTWSVTIITTTLSFQKTTTRLNKRHCAKNDSVSRSWTLGQGRILLETDVLTTHAELFVAIRGTWRIYERSVQNVSGDRLNKIHYSDHVKSQNSVILLHVTRSWIYFISQKLRKIMQTNLLFSWRMLDWTIYLHEQFWFLWSRWQLWTNWNENQIIIFRSFRIPVSLLKWNEKTYLLNIYIYIYIYIYMYVRRTRHWSDSQRTRRYIKEVDDKSFLFSRKSDI